MWKKAEVVSFNCTTRKTILYTATVLEAHAARHESLWCENRVERKEANAARSLPFMIE